MSYFPFKSLTLYRVKKSFTSQSSNDTFTEGSEVAYMGSTTNHYDEIEICRFKERKSERILLWHAHQVMDLEEKWKQYLEVIPWPK
jgi:hypothetical protein